MQLNLAWGTSTDPDWPANPLHYEMNYSTSTQLSDAGWIVPGPIPLATGNTYLVGIRAADDYGDVSVRSNRHVEFPRRIRAISIEPRAWVCVSVFHRAIHIHTPIDTIIHHPSPVRRAVCFKHHVLATIVRQL